MGYAKTETLHNNRPLDTLAALEGRTTFLVRGVDTGDATEDATGTDHGLDLIPALADIQRQQKINTQTGTTYTFVLTDAGKLVTCDNAAAISVTVPPNSSVAFPTGTRLDVIGIGAGIVTIVAGGGVTVSKATGQTLVFQDAGSACTLVKLATDTWRVVGRFADV